MTRSKHIGRGGHHAYPPELKAKAIGRVLDGKELPDKVADEIGVSRASLYNWVKDYQRGLLQRVREQAIPEETRKTESADAMYRELTALQAENRELKKRLEQIAVIASYPLLRT